MASGSTECGGFTPLWDIDTPSKKKIVSQSAIFNDAVVISSITNFLEDFTTIRN